MDKSELGYIPAVINPDVMSNKMLAENHLGGLNLNDQSYEIAFDALKQILQMGFKVKRIIADQVGPPGKQEFVMKKIVGYNLIRDIEIKCERKADDKYPVVSAASIVAKVTRDRSLHNWNYPEHQGMTDESSLFHKEFGCGYPSDPKTKTWLKEHTDPVFGFPTIVRFSWGTAKKILDEKNIAI